MLTETNENILHMIQRQSYIKCVIDKLLATNTSASLSKMEKIYYSTIEVTETLTVQQQEEINERLWKGLLPGGEFY